MNDGLDHDHSRAADVTTDPIPATTVTAGVTTGPVPATTVTAGVTTGPIPATSVTAGDTTGPVPATTVTAGVRTGPIPATTVTAGVTTDLTEATTVTTTTQTAPDAHTPAQPQHTALQPQPAPSSQPPSGPPVRPLTFLSFRYAESLGVARLIKTELEQHGFPVFRCDVPSGRNIEAAVETAIVAASLVVILGTKT